MHFWCILISLLLWSAVRVRGDCIAQVSNDSTVDCLCNDTSVAHRTSKYCESPTKDVQHVRIRCARDTQIDILSFYDSLLRAYPNLRYLQVRCPALANFTLLSSFGRPNFTSLRSLDVAENELTSFLADANLFPEVQHLDLHGNLLESESISLTAFRNVSTLDLSNNPLRTVDDRTFLQLRNITRLSLANCSLRQVLPLTFYANRRMQSLDLSGNQLLQRVSRELLLPMRSLRTLNLTDSSALFADCVPPHDNLHVRISPTSPLATFCSCDRVWLLRAGAATGAPSNASALDECLRSLQCNNLTVRMRARIDKTAEPTETVYLKYGDELRLDCDAPTAAIGYFRTPRFDQFWFVVYATSNVSTFESSFDWDGSSQVYVRNVSEPRRSEEDAARTRVFANGTLQIVRLGRRDAGVYVCIAMNAARVNETRSVRVLLDYTALQEVKLESVIMGLLAATCCIVVASCVHIVLFIVSQCKKVRTLKRIRELVQWSETHFAFNTHWNVPPLNLSGLVPNFVSAQFRRAPTADVNAPDAIIDEHDVDGVDIDIDTHVTIGPDGLPIAATLRADDMRILDSNLNAEVTVEDLVESETVDVLGVGVVPRRMRFGMPSGFGARHRPQTTLSLPLPPEEHVKLQRLRESVQIAMQRLTAQYGSQADRFGRLRDYSSERMERMRENYTEKLARFRTYRDAQFEKLRQNYRYQHQYLAKLWQALSLTQCVGEETELEFDLSDARDPAYFPVSGTVPVQIPLPPGELPASGSHRELEAAARCYYQLPPERRPHDGLRGVMRVRPLVHSGLDAPVQVHAHSESCSYPRRGTTTFQQARTCRCQQPSVSAVVGMHPRTVRISLLSTNFNLPFVDETEENVPMPMPLTESDEKDNFESIPSSSHSAQPETFDEPSSTETAESPLLVQDSVTPSEAGVSEMSAPPAISV